MNLNFDEDYTNLDYYILWSSTDAWNLQFLILFYDFLFELLHLCYFKWPELYLDGWPVEQSIWHSKNRCGEDNIDILAYMTFFIDFIY